MKNIIYFLIIATYFTGCAVKLTNAKKAALTDELKEMRKTDQIAASHWEEEWAQYKDSVFFKS
jgi:hypothetical protein